MRDKTRTITLLAVILTSMLAVKSVANGGHSSENQLLTKAIDEIVGAALDDGFAGKERRHPHFSTRSFERKIIPRGPITAMSCPARDGVLD